MRDPGNKGLFHYCQNEVVVVFGNGVVPNPILQHVTVKGFSEKKKLVQAGYDY